MRFREVNASSKDLVNTNVRAILRPMIADSRARIQASYKDVVELADFNFGAGPAFEAVRDLLRTEVRS